MPFEQVHYFTNENVKDYSNILDDVGNAERM